MHNYDNPEYFWVPIDWDVADYLLKKYQEDWEGITPNGIDLDSWYQNLKKASKKHSQIHFPHMHPDENANGGKIS